MGSILFLYLVFWMPALFAGVMAIMDFMEEKKFLAEAIETKGQIVGTVGARLKTQNRVDMAGMATGNITSITQGSDQVGGVLVVVEYEDEEGDTYQTRSKQQFNDLTSEFVSVQYNPEKPGDAIVDRFYSGNGKIYQLIGAGVLMITPFIIQYFMGV